MVDEGKKVIASYDETVEKLAGELKEKGFTDRTYSIVRWQGSAPALVLKELPPGQALTDLGLARPPAQDRDGRGHSDPVSLENIADIDADYMFFGTLGGSSVDNPEAGGSSDDAAGAEAYQTALGVPGFAELKAVTEHHVIPVDGSLWTSTGGPLLRQRIVEDVRTFLIEKNGAGL